MATICQKNFLEAYHNEYSQLFSTLCTCGRGIFNRYLLLTFFYQSRKSMNKFVNQQFLTNASGFIYKKRSCKNKKFHFPAKIYEIRQKY